jgi:hypothetical protein
VRATRAAVAAVFALVGALGPAGLAAEGAKLRLAASAGGAVVNELAGAAGFTGGGGLHLAYPVSPRERPVNVELAVVNWYNVFTGAEVTHLFRIGFGIRVFLNSLGPVRPYFTHDICSHLVWQEGRQGRAAALGILLGLGVDVPFGRGGGDRAAESSSWFCDLSYNTFELAHFAEPVEAVKFVALTCGVSWLLPGPGDPKQER